MAAGGTHVRREVPAGPRRAGLTRDRIVHAAVALIERDGPDISMRRLAAELGVGVMSLYNHVPSKAALLDGVAEYILAGIELTEDPAADWAQRVRAQVHAFRDIARSHPRCTMVVVARQLSCPEGLRPVERALETLRAAGFDGIGAVRVFRAFIAYTVGALLREVGATPTLGRESQEGRGALDVSELDPAAFPNVIRLAPQLGQVDHDEEFAFGLELLIQAVSALRPGGPPRAAPAQPVPPPPK